MPRKKNHQALKELIHYGIVMGFISLFDLGLFILLVEMFSVQYLLAAVLSFTIGIFLNYYLNVHYTFSQRRFSDKRWEITLYVCSSLLSLVANVFLLWFMTEILGIYYVYSRIIAGAMAFFSLFWIRKAVLFTKD